MRAAEQDRPDVARHRQRWRGWQPFMDGACFVFVDETSASTDMVRRYGWGPRGERLVDVGPAGHWKTTTFVAGLRHDGVIAPFVLNGPMTGEVFRAYVEQMLAPALFPGDVVVMDNLPAHTVQADTEQNLLFVERVRRVNLTGVRAALNGYQRGRCFYCRAEMPLATTEVDHFFPWVLKERGQMPDGDGVWNLVLSCQSCNRGQQGKFATVPAPELIARLHERNSWLVDSHHPLRETIMLQTGADAEARTSFLRARQRIALDALVHEWQPAEMAADG